MVTFCIPLRLVHCISIFCGPNLGFLTKVSRILPNFDIACQPLTVYAIFKSLVVLYIYLCNYLNILSGVPWIIKKKQK